MGKFKTNTLFMKAVESPRDIRQSNPKAKLLSYQVMNSKLSPQGIRHGCLKLNLLDVRRAGKSDDNPPFVIQNNLTDELSGS